MKVEKIWAELSAKAQEAKEVELSEEKKVELGAKEMYKRASDYNAIGMGMGQYDKLAAAHDQMLRGIREAEMWLSDLEKDMADYKSKLKELDIQAEQTENWKYALDKKRLVEDALKDAKQREALVQKAIS